MGATRFAAYALSAIAWLVGAGCGLQAQDRPPNAMCLGCHGNPAFAMPRADGQTRPLHVNKDQFEHTAAFGLPFSITSLPCTEVRYCWRWLA